MITVYYSNTGNMSNKRVIEWFELRNIQIKKIRIRKISKEDLLHILEISSGGFSEILKNERISNPNLAKNLDEIYHLNFNSAVDTILQHPNFLKTPVIVDEERLLVGYNSEDIRMFLPREYKI